MTTDEVLALVLDEAGKAAPGANVCVRLVVAIETDSGPIHNIAVTAPGKAEVHFGPDNLASLGETAARTAVVHTLTAVWGAR